MIRVIEINLFSPSLGENILQEESWLLSIYSLNVKLEKISESDGQFVSIKGCFSLLKLLKNRVSTHVRGKISVEFNKITNLEI